MAKAIHKAANGTKYVYDSISYWDKQKKAPRTKQVYLGKDAVAKSNVDEFLFCRKAGSSTLPKRLYPER